MANDIVKANSAQDINHGVAIIDRPGTGVVFRRENEYNTPVIAVIQSKYDTRFDDPTYYA